MEENIKRRNEENSNCLLKRQKTDALLSEDFINFISEPPTLQNIAITTIGISLWKHSETIRNLKKEGHFVGVFRFPECCRKLEENILNQPTKSFLPCILKAEVLNVIRPIGLQLSTEWYSGLQEYCALTDLRLLEFPIYWTAEGTIDKARSLEECINKGIPEIDICKAYKLACTYCLEGHVLELLKRMPPDSNDYDFLCCNSEDDIVLYWTLVLNNKLQHALQKFLSQYSGSEIYSRGFNIYQNMISWSVFFGNLYALKYFWQKVTESEKKVGIVTWIKKIIRRIASTSKPYSHLEYNPYTHVLCFLLSHLKDECQQKEIFMNHSKVILVSLFRSWPFQRFFLSVILTILNFLKENIYVMVMSDVVNSIGEQRNTEKIFRSIWCSSPSKLKTAFLKRGDNQITKLLIKLVNVNDVYTAQLILKDTSSTKKECIAKNLIYNSDFKEYLSSKKDLDIIVPVLKEIFPEDGNIQSFKLRVLLYYTHDFPLCYKMIEKGDFQAIDSLLQWSFQSFSEIEDFKARHFDPFQISSSLIYHEAYDRVHQFLRWYFESEEKILEFKKAFLRQDSLCHFKEILLKCAPNWKGWSQFEKFKNIFLSSSENAMGFKKICIQCVESVVEKHHFSFASRLLNWCFDSPQEVNRFKIDLLFSETGIKRIDSADPSVWDYAGDLFMWSFPSSKETIAELKLLLNHGKDHVDGYGCLWHNKRRDFFQLLDNVVRATGTSEEKKAISCSSID